MVLRLLISCVLLMAVQVQAAGVRVWFQEGRESFWVGAQELQVQNRDGSLSERLTVTNDSGRQFYLPLSDVAFIQADNKYFYVSEDYVAVSHDGTKTYLAGNAADYLFIVRNNYGGYTSFDFSALRRIIFE